MKSSTPGMWVAAAPDAVWIKISGRANFESSLDFKTLVLEMHQRGQRRFVLDLSECVLMDSTFLGVLSALGMRFSEGLGAQEPKPIVLLCPSAKVLDLLDNLGALPLFALVTQTQSAPNAYETVAPGAHDKAQLARNCCDAHLTLMGIRPENVTKFKEVVRFLEEDLQRLDGRKPSANSSA